MCHLKVLARGTWYLKVGLTKAPWGRQWWMQAGPVHLTMGFQNQNAQSLGDWWALLLLCRLPWVPSLRSPCLLVSLPRETQGPWWAVIMGPGECGWGWTAEHGPLGHCLIMRESLPNFKRRCQLSSDHLNENWDIYGHLNGWIAKSD